MSKESQEFKEYQVLPLTADDIQLRRKKAEFDFIIVGAGTSGSLLAYNLATTFPHLQVAVIEAGQDDPSIRSKGPGVPYKYNSPNPNDPLNDYGQLIRQGVFGANTLLGVGAAIWHYFDEAKSHGIPTSLKPVIIEPKGSTWGGSSAVNIGVWQRGTKAGTWDRWEDILGCEWSFEATTKSYKVIENRNQIANTNTPVNPTWAHFFGANKKAKHKNNANDTVNNMVLPPPLTDYNTFNPKYQGANGKLLIHSTGHPIYVNSPVHQAITESLLQLFPQRFDQKSINQTWEDPDFDEIMSPNQFTLYDQTDKNYLNITPYSSNFPNGPFARASVTQRSLPGALAGSENPLPAGRSFAAPSYLYKIKNMKNVTIISRAYVTKLLLDDVNTFENTATVVGVEFVKDGWNVNLVGRSNPSRPSTEPTIPPTDQPIPPLGATIPQGSISPFSLQGARPEDAKQNVDILDKGNYNKIYATGDVFVCAGVIETAAILQRSGIGNKHYLENLPEPVQVYVDLPGVGYNVKNHPGLTVEVKNATNYVVPTPNGPIVLPGISYYVGVGNTLPPVTTIRFKSDPTKEVSNLQVIVAMDRAVTYTADTYYETALNNVGLTYKNPNFPQPQYDPQAFGGLLNFPDERNARQTNSLFFQLWDPKATGTILIRSPCPFEPPRVNENLLGDERDVEDMVNAMKYTIFPLYADTTNGLASKRLQVNIIGGAGNPFFLDRNGGPQFTTFVTPSQAEIVDPNTGSFNVTGFRNYLSKNVHSTWHLTSSCKMGRTDDKKAVCDYQGRVFQVKGLRLCDASIFPTIPDGNTQAPCYVVAQRISEMIIPQYEKLYCNSLLKTLCF